MKVDNYISEGLDAPPLRAEDQDGLPILDQPPRGREAEFTLIVGKEPGPLTLRRNPVRGRRPREESLDPGPFIANAQVEARGG